MTRVKSESFLVSKLACARSYGLFGILALSACGAGAAQNQYRPGDITSRTSDPAKVVVDEKAKEEYAEAVTAFRAADEKGDWSACDQVAQQFVDAAKRQKDKGGQSLDVAHYNAGLAYMRCGKVDKAKAEFTTANSGKSNLWRAEAQLALLNLDSEKNLTGTIATLKKIVEEKAKFQYVEGLVSMAALQMVRGEKSDLDEAEKNLQRALALDDSYMPAFNQLALLYLAQAKSRSESGSSRRKAMVVSGGKKKRLNRQQLDLAALVTAQAVKKNPNYAPIHNTAGLILVELENYNGAVKEFRQARQYDPRFFEAHMNYAAVNLSFRGFKEAEKAYRDALKLHPNDFEAHLGLALALRGQVNAEAADKDKLLGEAQQHLDTAKKLDGSRAETYYNEAILTEAKSKGGLAPDAQVTVLREAVKRYQDFVSKASGNAAFAEAVKRSQTRIVDTSDIICFLLETKDFQAEEAAKKAGKPKPAAAAKPECEFVKAAREKEPKKK